MFQKQSLAKILAIGLIAASSPNAADAFEDMSLPKAPVTRSELIVEQDLNAVNPVSHKTGGFAVVATAAATSAITTAFLKALLLKNDD